MHKHLIIKAFKKAKEYREEHGIKKPSKSILSEDLSNNIEQYGADFKLSSKQYRNYYDEAIKKLDSDEDISIKRAEIIEGLSLYLNYTDYKEFNSSSEIKDQTSIIKFSKKVNLKKFKTHIYVFGLLLTTLLVLIGFMNKDHLMIWDNNQYKEIPFKPNSFEKYQNKNVKLSEPLLVEKFKKIIPTCSTEFFKPNGKSIDLFICCL